MALQKNQEIEIEIESISSEGSGVGHYDGMVVFVANAAKGDRLKVHLIKVKKQYAIGKITKILTPSTDRIEIDCPHFQTCGGCAYRHINYEAELEAKKNEVEQAFLRLAHIDIKAESVCGGETSRYRNKGQYPVGFDNDIKIGFYAQRSHRITDCKDCLLQPEEFSELTEIFRNWIKKNGISVYDEETGRGFLRHIYLRKATATDEIMVCAVINGDSVPALGELTDELKKAKKVSTFVLNINKKKTNVILGDKSVNVFGDGYITDILCGNKIRISPMSFYQVNSRQTEKLYKKAAEYADLQSGDTLVDMYCGAGTIGLSMAAKAGKVIGIEIVPQAVEDAKANAEANGIENAEFYCSDASAAASILKEKGIKPACIVLDPPRKGCDPSLIQTVSEMEAGKIVYVSCNPATLARDCVLFKELGYTTEKMSVFDLFPRTTHVETVVLMTKK